MGVTQKRRTTRSNRAVDRRQKIRRHARRSRKSITVIGLGGIWANAYMNLMSRMAYDPIYPKEITLIDKDMAEPGNIPRQHFRPQDVGLSKAEVYERRIKEWFPSIKVRAIKSYVNQKNLGKFVPNGSTVLSYVDNQDTRKMICEHTVKLKDSVVITGANDEMIGNSHLFLKRKGVKKTKQMHEYDDRIAHPNDKSPEKLSCEEKARLPGGGQTALANMAAALCSLTYLEHLMKGDEKKVIERSEVFFSLNKLMFDTVSRSTGK